MLITMLCMSSVLAEEALPSAETLMDQYVEACGGVAAFDKIQNRIIKSTLEITGAGISIDIDITQAKPNKAYSIIDSPATGKIESGYDGETAWEVSAMSGPQLKEGKEKLMLENANIFDGDVYWRKVYKKVETVAQEKVNDRMCYKVVLHPANGADIRTYFLDQETHMIRKVETTIESQMGKIQLSSFPTDYRDVDGVKISFKTTMDVMGQQRIVTIRSIEHNVDLPADRFALPEEIKALVAKQKDSTEEK
jgi:outer membrane lipoprotein-sorting protein